MAWLCATVGLGLGTLTAWVPGLPGCVVAWLGVAAYAGLTDFAVVSRRALVLAGLVALVGTLAQVLAPVLSARAAGGTAGAATGALLGAGAGVLVALPGAGVLGGVLGALLGGIFGSQGTSLARRARGVVGAAGGCMVAVLADFVAVLGVGAVLALAEWAAAWAA